MKQFIQLPLNWFTALATSRGRDENQSIWRTWNGELVSNRHRQRIASSDLRRRFVDQSATKERHRSQEPRPRLCECRSAYRYLYLYRQLGIRAQRCSRKWNYPKCFLERRIALSSQRENATFNSVSRGLLRILLMENIINKKTWLMVQKN